MSSPSVQQKTGQQRSDFDTAGLEFAPFELDITFIEGTPAAETVLMCSMGDTCGSSCSGACTTS
ncbi:FxLD family lanthipeptide [Actinomadura terrae]|uniref:FxLD family lanthipeptide n=1 Tax=Actinomadura terrae TaxID=604353 RepID=UPI001FA6F4E8|nr:FxLD family lanthipeptide [Actinomadura terrae]